MDTNQFPVSFADQGNKLPDAPGQVAAVGITQDESLCAAACCCCQRLERVVGVGRATVEKVISVIDDTASVDPQVPDQTLDHATGLIQAGAERLGQGQR